MMGHLFVGEVEVTGNNILVKNNLVDFTTPLAENLILYIWVTSKWWKLAVIWLVVHQGNLSL